MNGRRRGTREEYRKQALRFSLEYGDEQTDARWDRRTRLARPNSQARTRTANNSFSLFSCGPRVGLATLPGCEGHTYKHSSTYTYRCSYTYIYMNIIQTVNRARMYMSPNNIYIYMIYLKQYKQQHCTSTYTYMYLPRIQLTTSRFGNLTRLIHHTLLYVSGGRTY